MADYQNSGILFRNDDKKNDRAPDYSGKLDVEGHEYRLAGWIKQVSTAISEVILSTIWQKGVADMKPSKDMDAYNKFKDAVVRRGVELKNTVDVEAKNPAKTFDEVMTMICNSLNADDLQAIGTLIDRLPVEDQKILNAKYEEQMGTFGVAA